MPKTRATGRGRVCTMATRQSPRAEERQHPKAPRKGRPTKIMHSRQKPLLLQIKKFHASLTTARLARPTVTRQENKPPTNVRHRRAETVRASAATKAATRRPRATIVVLRGCENGFGAVQRKGKRPVPVGNRGKFRGWKDPGSTAHLDLTVDEEWSDARWGPEPEEEKRKVTDSRFEGGRV